MLGEVSFERLRDLLPLHQHVAQVERVAEHPVDPLAVNRRIGSVAVLVLVPLLMHLPQCLGVLGVVSVHPLREALDEHRQAQERSRDLDERQPFGVVLGDGHSLRPLLFRDSVDQVVYMVSRIFVCVLGVLSKVEPSTPHMDKEHLIHEEPDHSMLDFVLSVDGVFENLEETVVALRMRYRLHLTQEHVEHRHPGQGDGDSEQRIDSA